MRKIFYICCVLLCAACAKAPTDAQLQDLCRNAGFAVAGQKDAAAKQAAFRQTMEEGSKAFDIHRIAPAQIDMMFNDGGATLDDMLREWFQPVLEQKALAKGEEGLTFSFYRWKYLPSAYRYEPRREAGWEVYKALITAPGFGEWLAAHPDYADDIVRGAAQIDGDVWVKLGMVDEVVALVKSSLPDKAALSSMNVFNKAFVAKQLPDETKNAIRESVLAQYKALLQTERYSKGDRREEVENGIHYLESPYATGTLVGNAAPALDFLWISGGKLGDQVRSVHQCFPAHARIARALCPLSGGNHWRDFHYGLSPRCQDRQIHFDRRKTGIRDGIDAAFHERHGHDVARGFL